MTEIEKSAVASSSTGCVGELPGDFEIGRLSSVHAPLASEIGAAIAHELNGPMTALLLYLGDIQQSSDRLIDASLQPLIESAFLEAERVCALIHKMSDLFEAPISEGNAIGVAREAIASWARNGHPDSKLGGDAGGRAAGDSSPSGAKPLTPREQEVLRLVSEGHSNKEGAMRMKISYRTFECHRAEVMRKMGARNTADLVRLALLDRPAICAPTQQNGVV